MTYTRSLRAGFCVSAVLLVIIGLLVPAPVTSWEHQVGKTFIRATLEGVEMVPATSKRA